MKILLSAYYCDPEGISEYYVGFKFWELLSEKHDVHLITDLFKKPNWERFLAKDPEKLKKIHFVDLTNIYRLVPKLFNLPYYAYNVKAYFLAKRLMKEHSFDLIHHVTASMFRFPVFMSGLGLPFVWGPIGGSVPEPEGFSDLFGGDRFDRRFRKFDKWIARYDPMIHSTMNNASRILVATKHFFEMFPEKYHAKMQQFSLCGFDAPPITPHQVKDEGPSAADGLNILFVGRIVPYKGLQFLLEAIGRVHRRVKINLRVAGAGPYLEKCQALVAEFAMGDSVTFLGKISHEKVMDVMALSDVYVIPSLRESWGISPMEAMSMSIPVIGIDNGGLSEVLDPESSILIKPESSSQVVDALTVAIEKLASNPELRKQMGASGRERVLKKFSWEKIGQDLESIYASVLREAAGGARDTREEKKEKAVAL
jgi:glycosyltransferase involved in cell wall biosynthesis